MYFFGPVIGGGAYKQQFMDRYVIEKTLVSSFLFFFLFWTFVDRAKDEVHRLAKKRQDQCFPNMD